MTDKTEECQTCKGSNGAKHDHNMRTTKQAVIEFCGLVSSDPIGEHRTCPQCGKVYTIRFNRL